MDYDVIVIGSGPGGYVAAIRAGQLGLKTACVEKYPSLGGTCLNVGCIPSKAMLHASERFHEAQEGLAGLGIEVAGVTLNLKTMMQRKDKIVTTLTQGVAGLLKKNKVDAFRGSARLAGSGKVAIDGGDGTRVISGRHIIIATGSKPTELPFLKYDKRNIVDSTGALVFDRVPERLLVVGGGVIGLELGSVWARLGARVTVVEFLDRILAPMDGAVSREMKKLLTRQGLTFHLNTGVTGAEQKDGVVIATAKEKSGKEHRFEADKVLVAVGRRPYTDGLGLDDLGVTRDKHGYVTVDGRYRTAVEGVYAIGDVIGGLMLAHKAEEEGIACVETIAGMAGHVNYEAIPNIVYTWPEVACVGKTEEALKAEGVPYKIGQFPFKANARARCSDLSDGFIKVIAHAENDRILGVHMIGASVSEMICEAVTAMEFAGSAEDLARTSHGHPTLTEAIKEAALSVDKRAIHI